MRCFFSLGASFVRSTSSSLTSPLTDVCCGSIPFRSLSYVGNLSSAAHLRSTSSSSLRSLLPQTLSSAGGMNTSLKLLECTLPLPLIVRTRSWSRPNFADESSGLMSYEERGGICLDEIQDSKSQVYLFPSGIKLGERERDNRRAKFLVFLHFYISFEECII